MKKSTNNFKPLILVLIVLVFGLVIGTSCLISKYNPPDLLSTEITVITAPATEPTTTAPATEPTTTAPTTEPTTTAPATEPPTTAPATELPTTAPATEPPTTAPATEPPTTAPATEPPTTAPATEPPTTAPATEPPTTEPETTAPATTESEPDMYPNEFEFAYSGIKFRSFFKEDYGDISKYSLTFVQGIYVDDPSFYVVRHRFSHRKWQDLLIPINILEEVPSGSTLFIHTNDGYTALIMDGLMRTNGTYTGAPINPGIYSSEYSDIGLSLRNSSGTIEYFLRWEDFPDYIQEECLYVKFVYVS